jgi:hypothetical protein
LSRRHFLAASSPPPPNAGPVTELGAAHQAVREWSEANGYRLAGPHWEIYGDPDPSSGHFDVQVFWSLAAAGPTIGAPLARE